MSRDIYHIATDYFKGRITVKDRKYLDEWLDQTPDNKEMFAEFERVWKLTGSLEEKVEVDVDQEWSRFLENRYSATSEPGIAKPLRKLWKTPLFKVAAITIPAVLVMTSLLIFYVKGPKNQEWLTVNSGNYKLEQLLPDGSKVWMNNNSVLSYPKNFKGEQRRVKFKGEGFFIVVKGKGRFTIEAGKSEIQVLGTQFNVRHIVNELFTEVSVKEGKVSFSSLLVKERNVLLLAGNKGLLNNNTNEIEKKENSSANSDGWLTKKLKFDNTPLSQVAKDIERYFSKQVLINNADASSTLSGTFTNPTLEEVLHTINLTLSYNCLVKNDTVIIKK